MDSILALLNVHNSGRLYWRLMLDRRVPLALKIYAVAGFIYFFSPLDVVPHDFTGMGLIDDLIVALVIMQAFIEMTPEKIFNEHCEQLGLDPEKVLLPAPVIISDAMEMFFASRERKMAGRARSWGYYRYHEPGSSGEERPPYTKYSAYRKDE